MEMWRKVWREGAGPLLSIGSLEALGIALAADDSRIIQGATTQPPPLQCVMEWPTEASCPLSYAGWVGDGLETVGEVEEFFARLCYSIDMEMGEPAACRWLINWIDETPRSEMIQSLLAEVQLTIKKRLTPVPQNGDDDYEETENVPFGGGNLASYDSQVSQ